MRPISKLSIAGGATPKPSVGLIVMDKEKRALVEQAARCRNAAVDIDHHPKAAKRLRKMAMEYESRAAGLDDQQARLKASRRRRLAEKLQGDQ